MQATTHTRRCSDQACDVKKALANPEPSTHGPLRHSPLRTKFSRYWKHSRHPSVRGDGQQRRV